MVERAKQPITEAVVETPSSLQRVKASIEKYAADLRVEFGDSQYHIHWGPVFSRIGELIEQTEKLSPDRERRALEIAARLAAHLLLEDIEHFECFRFGATVLVQLYDLDSLTDVANWAPQNFTTIQRTIKHMDDLATAPETKAWLQQAREFFQAEEENNAK